MEPEWSPNACRKHAETRSVAPEVRVVASEARLTALEHGFGSWKKFEGISKGEARSSESSGDDPGRPTTRTYEKLVIDLR